MRTRNQRYIYIYIAYIIKQNEAKFNAFLLIIIIIIIIKIIDRFYVHVQCMLVHHTPVMGTYSGMNQLFRPRRDKKIIVGYPFFFCGHLTRDDNWCF